jgi:mRNA-degrading endonuclease RelE of RelBE toxin-antitoxin system
VKYAPKLSARAVKDLDALDGKTQKRMLDRIAELADAPYDPKLSIFLVSGANRLSEDAPSGTVPWTAAHALVGPT